MAEKLVLDLFDGYGVFDFLLTMHRWGLLLRSGGGLGFLFFEPGLKKGSTRALFRIPLRNSSIDHVL